MSSVSNNKRIAKNTLVLYIRMLFTMAVSLYTSRVVLATLGISDYGIYNVVGGIVVMFGFLNNSMSSATQRYITFALGKNDTEKLKKTFTTALQIHTLIAAIVVILSETIGLWFLYNKMQIPQDRMTAAFWVLQCSIISTAIMIVSVPYNSGIIAHEKMSAFAYISIVEVVLKLIIVYLLTIFPVDKLVLYAFLLLAVQILIRFCYTIYCHHHFEETTYQHVWDRGLFKEMTNFAGWSIFGNLSAILFTEGLNMLLNVFFGPFVNAARGIACQVQGAIQQFVGNFQTALNPQITKTYAQGDLASMHQLMYRSARFSFFMLFILALPVLFETHFILKLWLKDVPPDTVVFLRIMICTSLIYTIANPMVIANQATGKVKKYQMVCGSILLMILPISYILLRIGCPAYTVFIVHFGIEFTAQIARMIMLRPLINIGIHDYIRNIYAKISLVVVVATIIPGVIYFNLDDTIARFFIVCLISALSVVITAYTLGLTRHERQFVTQKVISVVKRLNDQHNS